MPSKADATESPLASRDWSTIILPAIGKLPVAKLRYPRRMSCYYLPLSTGRLERVERYLMLFVRCRREALERSLDGMIVSHGGKFVFIKTKKTASTSIEAVLREDLNANDLWTPSSVPKVVGNRHYSAWPPDYAAAHVKFFRRKSGLMNRLYFRYFHDHASISELYRGYGRTRFDDYYKFCFERNPWDYVVSLYYYRMSKQIKKVDFDEFLYTGKIPINWNLYTLDNKIAVDDIFRYENIQRDMASVRKRLNLGGSSLPVHWSGLRSAKNYRSYYTQTTRDEIASRFEKVIDHLGYDF